jgi:F-type H+-transporting ATPase subunit epsilon
MNTIRLSIVTPDGSLFDDDVKSVVLPGKDGEFGVLPGHTSLVSALTVGVVEIEHKNGSKDAIAINWGYVKVNATSVDALIDSAVALKASKDSDISKQLAKARELVKSVQDSNVSVAAVESRINAYA